MTTDTPLDADPKSSLEHDDPAVRLRAAWQLGAQAAGFGGSEPSPSQRRGFMLPLAIAGDLDALSVLAELDPAAVVRATAVQFVARMVRPDDTSTVALLVRLAESGDAEVIEAIAASLQADIPDDAVQRLQRAFRRAPASAREATLGWTLHRSGDAGQFLGALAEAEAEALVQALALLRTSDIDVQADRLPDWLLERDLSVVSELALLCDQKVDRAPLALWLRCASHCRDLLQEREDVLQATARGLAAAAAHKLLVTQETERSLIEALRAVVGFLPQASHRSYLSLCQLGLVAPDAAGPASLSALRKRAQAISFRQLDTFATLWLALVRLAPRPAVWMFELQPAYR